MTEAIARRPVAVLGAGGYIGQHFLRLLADHPWFEPTLLAAGASGANRTVDEVWRLPEAPPAAITGRRLVRATPAAVARAGVTVAFGGLPSGTAGPFERELARRGVAVFSNASDLRGADGVPLLVPEVNEAHLALLDRRAKRRAPIVTNPNCSATGLALALAPILPVLRPRSVHVATYQALSGAGWPGVPSLAIADNVLPFIADEEEKLAAETRRLLGRRQGAGVRSWATPVHAHCARVATREGHLEAVTLEATRRPTRRAILDAWRRFDPLAERGLPTAPHPPVEVREEADRPQPLRDRWAGSPPAARGMAATVGRVRWDAPVLRFFVLSHNAVRGGAGGSVLNAELALADGWLG